MLSKQVMDDIDRRIDDEMDFERVFYSHSHECFVRKVRGCQL